jgi:hypothetical protein
MKAWKRFERSDAMRDTLEEIRKAGKLSLMPVTSPTPAAESSESDPPDESRIAHSNHNSMNSHSVTATIP